MAVKYLLHCECGADQTVETHQAGGTVTCECGAVLQVPALRKLKELPEAAEAAPDSQPGWNFNLGVLTAGLLAACGLLAIGGYIRSTEIKPPPEFNAETRNVRFAENVDQLLPAQAYLIWGASYQNLGRMGFTPFKDRRRAFAQKEIDKSRSVQNVLFIAAGIVAVGSVMAFLAIPGEKKPAGTAS